MAEPPHLILIIEDHLLVALAVKADIERAGFRVEIAASLEEANALLQRQTPAAAIVDLNLRRPFDGVLVARRLTELGAKVLVCSAYGQSETDATGPPLAGGLAPQALPAGAAGGRPSESARQLTE